MTRRRSSSDTLSGNITGPGSTAFTRTFGASSTANSARERGDTAFRGEVGAVISVGSLDGPVADVHDRAALFLLDHDLARVLAADECAQGVYFEEAANIVGHYVGERGGRPDRGAVDEGIQPAEMAAGAVDHGAGGFFVAEIGAKCDGRVAGVGQLMHQFLGAIERFVGVNGDCVTARGKLAHDSGTDADCAAGD